MVNINNLTYEELKEFTKALIKENEELKHRYESFDYSILEKAYLESRLEEYE